MSLPQDPKRPDLCSGLIALPPMLSSCPICDQPFQITNGGPMRYVVAMMLIVLTILDMTVARVSFADEPLSMGGESLQGLPGVYVLIEHISPEARADGLSKEAIRTAVELILRASGILEITEKEVVEHTLPLLWVRINAAKVGPSLYAYCVDVQLMQM